MKQINCFHKNADDNKVGVVVWKEEKRKKYKKIKDHKWYISNTFTQLAELTLTILDINVSDPFNFYTAPDPWQNGSESCSGADLW